MHNSGLRRWVGRGVLVAAAWALSACGVLPQQAGNDTFQPGFTRGPDMPLYNGTIEQNPTSIDPRTPAKAGTEGRSLAMDRGQQALLNQELGGEGVGGSGMVFVPARPSYESLGAAGSVISPSNQLPAAQSLPVVDPGPVGGRSGALLRTP